MTRLTDGEIRRLVEENYELRLDGEALILRNRQTGKVCALLPGCQREVGLRCNSEWSEAELRELGLMRTEAEWVRLLAPPEWVSRAEWRAKYGNADERTVKYLNAVLRRLGVAGELHNFLDGSDSPILAPEEVKETFRLGACACGPVVEIGQKDGRWIVQRTDVMMDDMGFTIIRFERRPSRKDVETAFEIERIYLSFRFGGIQPTFQCWECGLEHHWLDIPAKGLTKRLEMFREQYCGC